MFDRILNTPLSGIEIQNAEILIWKQLLVIVLVLGATSFKLNVASQYNCTCNFAKIEAQLVLKSYLNI